MKRMADFDASEIAAIRCRRKYQSPQELALVFETTPHVIGGICKQGTAVRALDEDAVCADYRSGKTQRFLAEKYAVKQPVINRIIKRGISSDERAAIACSRDKTGAAKRCRQRQREKIQTGIFQIESAGDYVVARIEGRCFLLDAVDGGLLKRYPWRVCTQGRLVRQAVLNGRNLNIYIYHDILGVTPSRELVVDHINRDISDNRRANLRLCTIAENNLNRGQIERFHAHPMARKGERQHGAQ